MYERTEEANKLYIRMEPTEKEITEKIELKIKEVESTIANCDVDVQMKKISKYRKQRERWLQMADTHMFINLFRFVKDHTPETFEIRDNRAIEAQEAYIELYPDDTGIDANKAGEFFNDVCREVHGSDYDLTCPRRHLHIIYDYYEQRQIEEAEKHRKESLLAKKQHVMNDFFGSDNDE
ncbi:hypothetical protein VD172_002331 [Enterococcus faecium]|nr:hypothetical protein [Enterococcus faecium]